MIWINFNTIYKALVLIFTFFDFALKLVVLLLYILNLLSTFVMNKLLLLSVQTNLVYVMKLLIQFDCYLFL